MTATLGSEVTNTGGLLKEETSQNQTKTESNLFLNLTQFPVQAELVQDILQVLQSIPMFELSLDRVSMQNTLLPYCQTHTTSSERCLAKIPRGFQTASKCDSAHVGLAISDRRVGPEREAEPGWPGERRRRRGGDEEDKEETRRIRRRGGGDEEDKEERRRRRGDEEEDKEETRRRRGGQGGGGGEIGRAHV